MVKQVKHAVFDHFVELALKGLRQGLKIVEYCFIINVEQFLASVPFLYPT